MQGSSASNNLVSIMDRLDDEGLNVRIVAVISEDLFNLQPEEYRRSILPDAQRFDCMVVTTMTRRVMPIANLGPLTDEYTLASDHDDRWRTGGMEEDVIAEAQARSRVHIPGNQALRRRARKSPRAAEGGVRLTGTGEWGF